MEGFGARGTCECFCSSGFHSILRVLLHVNDLLYVICNIVIYADGTKLYFSVIRLLFCGITQGWPQNLNQTYKNLWTGVGSGLLILMPRNLSLSHWTLSNWITIDLKIDRSIIDDKTTFKMLKLFISSKFGWGS